MARKGKFDHLKDQAFQLWKQGHSRRAISRELSAPVSTVNTWCIGWDNADSNQGDSDSNQPTDLASKRLGSDLNQKPPRPNLVPISGGREHYSKYKMVTDALAAILKSPGEGDGVRVQAANAMLKAIALSADLPQHVLMEEQETSITASVAEVEEKGNETIAQDYREMLG